MGESYRKQTLSVKSINLMLKSIAMIYQSSIANSGNAGERVQSPARLIAPFSFNLADLIHFATS